MVYGKSLEVGESPIRQNMTGTNQPPEKTPRTCEQSCSHVDNLYFRCSFQHTEQTSIFNKMNKFNLFESLCSTFFNQRNPLQGQSIDGIRSIRSITFFFLVQSLLTPIFNIFPPRFIGSTRFPTRKTSGPHLAWASASLGSRWLCRGANFREQLTVWRVFFFWGGKLQQFICFLWTKHGNILLKSSEI